MVNDDFFRVKKGAFAFGVFYFFVKIKILLGIIGKLGTCVENWQCTFPALC